MEKKKFRKVALLLLFVMFLNSMTVMADVKPGAEEMEEVISSQLEEEVEDLKEDEPDIPDVPEKNVDVTISYELDGNIGKKSDLPGKAEKDYIKAALEPTLKLKDALDFKNKGVDLVISKDNYDYKMSKLEVGGKEISSTNYEEQTVGDYFEDGLMFDQETTIIIYMKGEEKKKTENVNIKVTGIDKHHKDSEDKDVIVERNSTLRIEYTGEKPNDWGIKAEIEDNKVKVSSTKYKGSTTVSFDGYNLEGGTLTKKDGEDNSYTVELIPSELPRPYKLGKIKFNNIYNGENIEKDLRRDDKGFFIENPNKENPEEPIRIYLKDIIGSKLLNRSENSGLNQEKIYYGDQLEIKIDKPNDLVKKSLGIDYELQKKDKDGNPIDSTYILNITNSSGPGSIELPFDYERISYKVSVNDGEEQTFDLMKKDTKFIKFDSDKITSVKVNEAGEDLKGKNIDVETLVDKTIEIKTKEDAILVIDDYIVQNRIFGSVENLYEARKFQGLEGLIVLVNPIKQHDYNDKEVIIKKGQDYKLADRFEKEVIVGKDKEVSFYFTPRGKVRYKALYITRYDGDWHSSSDTNYAIEMGKDDKYKILHETEIFIDDSGKPISLVPKLFNDGNLELIKLEKSIVKDMQVDGYNGKVFDGYQYISYVSDPVMQVPNADTVFIFSYKQKANKPSDLVKFQLKETVDEARGKPGYSDGGNNIVDLEYPRYKDDYTVELTIDKSRFSCKEELRLFINDGKESLVDFTAVNKENPIKILDGAYIIKIDGDKDTVGEITFTILIKGSGEDDGDLFPRLKEKSNIKTFNSFTDIGTFALENTSSDPDAFIGIEMNYIGQKLSECKPTSSLKQAKVNIIKSELIGSEPIALSGAWNKRTIKTLSESKIDLNVLEKDASGNPIAGEYREDITRDEDKISYVYEAERDDEFIGVMNSEGKQINQDGKLLGKDTDIFIAQDKNMDIYLNYKKEIPEEIEKTKSEFTTSYKFLEMPYELTSTFDYKEDIRSKRQKEYLEDFQNDIKNYYDKTKRVEKVNNLIDKFYEKNKDTSDIEDNLISLKEQAELLKFPEFKAPIVENLRKKLEEIKDSKEIGTDKVVERQDLSQAIEDITMEEVSGSIESLNETLLHYLGQIDKKNYESGYISKYVIKDYTSSARKSLVENDYIVNHYDPNIVKIRTITTSENDPSYKEDYDENHRYVKYKHKDYTPIPLNISEHTPLKMSEDGGGTGYQEIIDKFYTVGDYKEEFYLMDMFEEEKKLNWKEIISKDDRKQESFKSGSEIDNDIPVIFLERVYYRWKLEEIKPPTKPEEKTGRNLDIVYRFYNEKGEIINKDDLKYKISYRDLPSYINRLGWKVNDFKENGYTYMDDGRGLKEGDIKYSDQLKNGKTTTLYLDYKGDGEIPSIDDSKYEYTVFHQEIDLDNLSALPKPIETFISKDKYPVGTVLSIEPSNREADGYVLLDENNQITNDYSSKDIEIKDEKKLGKEANYYFYRYAKVKEPDLKTVYKVEYTDANYNELAKSEIKKIQADVKTIKESAKYISSYKARIQNIDLKIDKIDNIEPIIHFIGQTGYTIKHEDGKYKLMRDNLVCAEIFKKSGENTLRFIYDVDNTPRGAEIVYDANNGNFGDSTSINRVNGEIGKRVASHSPSKTVRRSGYSFVRWTYDRNGSERLDDRIVKNGDYITLYAQWNKDSTGGGGGDKPDPKPEPKPDPKPEPSKPTDRRGREIGKIIEPKIEYELNKTDHFAYIKGYPDITVQPNGYITREEVAMVLYRLMEPEYRSEIETAEHKYSDVRNNIWSTKAIATLSNGELLLGYGDGSFKPNNNMTRAEISKVIARFTDTIVLETQMPDIIGHWAEDYINTAENKGWIKGYTDGSFKPNELLTRAEFVTMVNSLLDRKVKKENALSGLKQFKDLPEKWYYEQMIEAINGHEYKAERLSDGTEVWTKLVDTQFPD